MNYDELLKTFIFIVSECNKNRLLMEKAEEEEDLRTQVKLSNQSIQSANTGNTYFFGPEAFFAINDLSEGIIRATATLKDKCETLSFSEILARLIAHEILDHEQEVAKDTIKNIIKTAKDKVAETLETRNYIFPVYLFADDENDECVIGPVKFIKTKKFIETEDGLIPKNGEAVKRKVGFDFVKDINKYLKKYPWIAVIRIKDTQPKLARIHALGILRTTINTVRLFIRSSPDRYIGFADDCSLQESMYLLSKAPDEPNYTWEKHWKMIQSPTTYSELIESVNFRSYSINIIDSLIREIEGTTSFLDKRLLTALFWFGEAWKEQDPLVKCIQMSICLECLVNLDKLEGIADRIAERISYLCEDDYAGRAKTFDLIKYFYNLRSNAVHGERPKISEINFIETLSKVEYITRKTLLVCADLFGLMKYHKDPNASLNTYFKMLKLNASGDEVKKFLYAPTPCGSCGQFCDTDCH